MEKIHMAPEVCILQLDIPTSLEGDDNTSTEKEKEPRIDIVQTTIKNEIVPESKHIIAADVTSECAAVEKPRMDVQECSTESKDNVPQRDSAVPISTASESLQPNVIETEFIEISIYEQEMVKQRQDESKKELLKTTKDRPTEVKEHGVQEEQSEVSKQGMHNIPKSQDKKYVRMERIQPDTQGTLKEHEIMSVMIQKEPSIVIDPTSIQCENVPENKDLSSNFQPEKGKVKMTMVEVRTKEHDFQEHPEAVKQDMEGSAFYQKSVRMEEILKESDVPMVQVKEETLSVDIAKEPIIETTTRCKEVLETDRTTADVHPKMAAVEMTRLEVEVQEIEAESKENLSESDSTHMPTSSQSQDRRTEFVRVSLFEQDQFKPSQTVTELEAFQTAQDSTKKVGLQVIHDAEGAPHKKWDKKEQRMESSVDFETDEEINDVSTSYVQPDKTAVKMTAAKVPETCSESLSEPSEAPRAKTERDTADSKEKTQQDQEEGNQSTIQEVKKKKTVKIQNIAFPKAITITADEVGPQSMESSQVSHRITSSAHSCMRYNTIS